MELDILKRFFAYMFKKGKGFYGGDDICSAGTQ